MDETEQQRFEVECIAQRAEAIGIDPDRVRQALSRRPLPPAGSAPADPTPGRGLVGRFVPRRSRP